jgi:hypothetical protein
MEHLQATLPREQVIDGARLLNDFVGKFKAHVRGAMDSQGLSGGSRFVVTKELVTSFLSELEASKQRKL